MTKTPQIILLTNRYDFTCDYLIDKIRSNYGDVISYFRINSEDIINTIYEYDAKGKLIISHNSMNYDLSKVKSIYFRRVSTVFPSSLDNNNNNFINRERRDFLEGALLSLKAKWINPLFATIQGERKLLQLSIAKKLGLKTPSTLVTNDPQKIKKFIKRKPAIIKPISHGLQVTNEKTFSIYTSAINQNDIQDEKQLFEVPSFIQEKIENKSDIRVTVIDKSIFAVSIKKDNDEEIDWRKPTVIKSYSIISLPDEINDKLLKLNNELGLRYSAIDLIQTSEDDYIFLEVNPAGEWVWLERELELEISNKIIKALLE